jgi:peroxiredoxin
MRNDIVPGAHFPDYELTDHTATRRKLSELQDASPTIVILSRGGFCPKDRRQAEGLLQLHWEMEVGYCQLVSISTDIDVDFRPASPGPSGMARIPTKLNRIGE